MGRRHLPELEDQAWFPAVLRDCMTEFLSFMAGMAAKPLSPFADRLGIAMRSAGADTLVELGAGGGGPGCTIAGLLRTLGHVTEPRLVLTDLYPNLARLELARRTATARGIATRVVGEPVDATAVPADLRGFRLLCNAMHHLPETAARKMLADAVGSREGIAVVELVDRSLGGFIQVFSGLTIMLLASPFIRPFRISRLVYTYILPLIPLCTLWDGIISCLRVYDSGEIEGLIASLPPNRHLWESGRLPVPGTPFHLTYLIGTPPAA